MQYDPYQLQAPDFEPDPTTGQVLGAILNTGVSFVKAQAHVGTFTATDNILTAVDAGFKILTNKLF
jgi:hypothetical protein